MTTSHQGTQAAHKPIVVEVRDLVVDYGKLRAVDNLSFDVPKGSLFSFLGANGAGKSTAISCITTLLRPTAGTIHIGTREADRLTVGRDDEQIRRNIGVVFQNSILDPSLTVAENLRVRARMYGLDHAAATERIAELAASIQLDGFLDQRYGSLSGGQKRRADIVRALIHHPDILFLDEPTAGLDAASREQVWQTIDNLRAHEQLTVFLTTHYLEETERSDEVLIIDKGREVASGTPASLRERLSRSVLRVSVRDQHLLSTILTTHGLLDNLDAATDTDAATRTGTSATPNTASSTVITVPDSRTAQLILIALGDTLIDFEFQHGNMDDVFLSLSADPEPQTSPTR